MVAGPIAIGAGFVMSQTAEDEQIVFDRRERFEDHRQIEVRAECGWRPIGHVRAVGDVNEGHPLERASGRFGGFGESGDAGHHGFEHRQGHSGAEPFQKRPSRQLPVTPRVRTLDLAHALIDRFQLLASKNNATL